MNINETAKYIKYDNLLRHFTKHQILAKCLLDFNINFNVYKSKSVSTMYWLYIKYNENNNKHLLLQFSISDQTLLYFMFIHYNEKQFKKLVKIEESFLDLIQNKHCFLLKTLEQYINENKENLIEQLLK